MGARGKKGRGAGQKRQSLSLAKRDRVSPWRKEAESLPGDKRQSQRHRTVPVTPAGTHRPADRLVPAASPDSRVPTRDKEKTRIAGRRRAGIDCRVATPHSIARLSSPAGVDSCSITHPPSLTSIDSPSAQRAPPPPLSLLTEAGGEAGAEGGDAVGERRGQHVGPAEQLRHDPQLRLGKSDRKE